MRRCVEDGAKAKNVVKLLRGNLIVAFAEGILLRLAVGVHLLRFGNVVVVVIVMMAATIIIIVVIIIL